MRAVEFVVFFFGWCPLLLVRLEVALGSLWTPSVLVVKRSLNDAGFLFVGDLGRGIVDSNRFGLPDGEALVGNAR